MSPTIDVMFNINVVNQVNDAQKHFNDFLLETILYGILFLFYDTSFFFFFFFMWTFILKYFLR